MNIIVASLVRDEMDRFLPQAVRAWSQFADDIIVLDDDSEDGSFEFLDGFGVSVFRREAMTEAWGSESHARQELFEIAWSHARIGDYILWLDADMVPARDPRPLFSGAAGVYFPLYDLWEPRGYREDSYWLGHRFPRLWAVKKRNLDLRALEWNRRGIHCGHLPLNFPVDTSVLAPADFALLHYAYVHEDLRADKYVQYAMVSDQLSENEREHARSIMDAEPHVVPLAFEPEWALA